MSDNKPQTLTKVLCIEDDRSVIKLYARAFARAGYEVTFEQDGIKGLALAKSDRYDIILLDLMLPNLSGIEILKELRDPVQTPNLHAKIVISTNLEQQDEARTDIEQQVDGYFIKADITPSQLVEFLSHFDTTKEIPIK